MSLRIAGVSKSVAGEMHLHPVDLELQKGTMNVLLGPTLAGKTTLMRIMAGLEKPDIGAIFWDGKDVTGRRVQDREVAMIYQQFVNYPSLTVYENIASPLRLQKRSSQEIDRKVSETAELLRLTPFLDRKPNEISGGQQQRCAMARALIKDVGLVLMDEPLANLDYKLREELRIEIPRLFAASGSIFVYATTEPEEALLLGGNTATMWEGQITQFGPSPAVYRQPVDEITARVFSDPPMNFVQVSIGGSVIHYPNGQTIDLKNRKQALPDGEYRAGIRPHKLKVGGGHAGDIVFDAKVIATEITGSDTYLYLEAMAQRWIALVPGVRAFDSGQECQIGVEPADVFYFDGNGKTVSIPKPEAVIVGE